MLWWKRTANGQWRDRALWGEQGQTAATDGFRTHLLSYEWTGWDGGRVYVERFGSAAYYGGSGGKLGAHGGVMAKFVQSW